ncbi:FimV/HubP family polar landmark protein [Neisseria sicca]|uniref:FimV N-terminal domain / FimV C-terminal domain multi-domain protein n=1 Tax=Neisseria sicca VK64 TaxID=1095748 RepID=I2NU84_NEISI|nr:FimV/HubP family polar landmark protein [Neisseria sicca]EIG29395.1 FimV N-terminal domain / FimV C-terminal domain multi-domain protein [Neisseria sicca VK64]
MKNHHKIKLIAASVALAVSFGASAGLGGLNVQSHLGEPFSGSITVTGDEAQALLKGGKATVSNSNLRTSVRKSGDKAVVTIHSSKAIKDPVLIFQVGAGSQSREYTAIIDPAGYSGKTDGSSRARSGGESSSNSSADNNSYHSQFDRQAARDRINRAIQNGNQNETVRKEAVRKDKNNTNKPVQTQAQPSKQQQQSSVGANGTEIRYGKQHLVRQGETLTEIATKIRPQGMTVEQTIQALVNANPGVFIGKDADRMLAGKVLYIPMHGDMKSTASKPAQVKPPVQEGNKPQAQGSSEKAGTATPPKETPVENTKVENKKEDKKAESVQEAKPETKPAVTTAGTPEQNKAETGAASAEQVNVLPEPNASSATANTEPQEISQAQADVEARIASAVATEKQQEEASAEDSGLWRWLLIGGAAAAGLLLLLFLLGKRKNSAVAPVVGAIDQDDQDEDDLDISIEDHVFPAATAPQPQPQPQVVAETSKPEEDGLEIEDDFDDEVFFNEPAPVAEPAQENVDLDLNELDNTQASIVSGAVTIDEETEKRRDIDWDTVESTESVYEPEPENPYQHVAVVMEDRTAEVETEPQHEEETPSVSSFAATPVSSVSDDLPEAQPEAPEEEPIPFEVEIEEPKSETIDVVETEEAETKSEESEEGWDFFAEEPKTVKAIEPFPELGAQEETSSEVEAADKQADSSEEALDFVVEETEQPQPEADTQPFEIKQDEPLAFQDGEDFSIENTQEASADETIEWENLGVEDTADSSNEHSGFESGFISESVGMTAPLEAKYDLAKMYVEIGDPDAARETLTELLEDASGEIRNKAQALMNELNA